MPAAISLPRISHVTADPTAMTLSIVWKDDARPPDHVSVLSWIKNGPPSLLVLLDVAVFTEVRVINFGSAVGWLDNEELSIDAHHLTKIADEQV